MRIVQNIPACCANGYINSTRVRYRPVSPFILHSDSLNATALADSDSSKAADLSSDWSEIESQTNCTTLRLDKGSDYEVIVDSRTSIGYNKSLVLEAILIPRTDNRELNSIYSRILLSHFFCNRFCFPEVIS